MKVTFVPIVIGALGTITKGLLKSLEDLEVGGRVETIQTTALLRTARILRRVLETWGDLLSLKKPSANTDVKNSKGVNNAIRNSVSLLGFPSLGYVHDFSCEMSLVCCLKCPYSCFSFHFYFPVIFSVDPCVVSIVSGDCNQSSSVLFYLVFQSLYRCINAILNNGKSSSSFFPWHI